MKRNRCWSRRDDGHVSVFILMMVPVLMAVFALVWEAGQMLVVKSELADTAHTAARTGAHQIDEVSTTATGALVLDIDRAGRAAVEHLHASGVDGTAAVQDDRVIVLARTSFQPVLLPVPEQVIESQAVAEPMQPRSNADR